MDFDQYNKEKAAEKEANLQASVKVFDEARRLAIKNGWELKEKINYGHFQLFHRRTGWLYNLYPSNQRIYADPKHRGGFIHGIIKPWTLLDVVKEAIKLKP